MGVRDATLTIAVMLGAGLLSEPLAALLRIPRMLVLLGAGIALGPTGVALLQVPLTSIGAQLILTLGVSIILFHGGLQLSTRVLGKVALGLGMLAVPGVVLTAAIVAPVAAAAFHLPLSSGLLIGAALAPTDPAILVPLFDRLRVLPKVSQTIIAESALNDPTGAVLTLVVAGVVAHGDASLTRPLEDFFVQLVLSTALGVAFGVVLALLVSSHRAGLWRESSAVVVLAAIAGAVLTIDSAGGSGYLGAFLSGLIVGNMDRLGLAMPDENERDMRAFVATLADVMVMLVFVVLGASLPLRQLGTELLPALATIATLVLVARPLVVITCLVPDRRGAWSPRELLFVAATRETGVMPAALGAILVGMRLPHADLVVTTVALAVIATLGLQATTKPWLAARLALVETPPARPEQGVPLDAAD